MQVRQAYQKSMKELEKFFELRLKKDTFKVVTVIDRKTIDMHFQKKTPRWIVGWTNGKEIYILCKENFERDSIHKYTPKKYQEMIKHELAHAFFLKLSGGRDYPTWLWEGVSIYASGQLKKKKRPKKIKQFLHYYKRMGKGVYKESGFVVEALVREAGKGKLLELIKALKDIKSNKEFKKAFKEIYGFDLKYVNFNH
jgi:hypothetical protein